jgi:hypothetical protein
VPSGGAVVVEPEPVPRPVVVAVASTVDRAKGTGVGVWCRTVMRTLSRRRAGALTLVVALALVVSCGSDGPGQRRAPDPPGATASLTFTGDPGLDGPATGSQITCSFPAVDGLTISVLAHAPDPAFSYRVAVSANRVLVHVDAGAGPSFRERTFTGAGVSDFDPDQGARIDAELTELAPTTGTDPGSIGRITRLRGSLGCGDQTPGSTTLTLTGDTPAGRDEAARLDPVVVECYFASDEVTVIGIAHAGTTKVLLMVSFGSTGLNVQEDLGSPAPRSYTAPAGSATLTSNGARADGDAVTATGTLPRTLHITGTASCGTPIRS